MRIVQLDKETKKNILSDLLKRDPNQYGEYEATVKEIVENVRHNGDEALKEYTLQFDHTELDTRKMLVGDDEIAEAESLVDPELKQVMQSRLRTFAIIIKSSCGQVGLMPSRMVPFLARK